MYRYYGLRLMWCVDNSAKLMDFFESDGSKIKDYPYCLKRFKRVMGLIGLLYLSHMHASTTEQSFSAIYASNHWASKESVSGPGSTLHQTKVIRKEIPVLLKKYGIQSMVDAPCGDFNWMKMVDLGAVFYTGVEIVNDLVVRNQMNYGTSLRLFVYGDIITTLVPKADLIFCRDCLVHLSFAQACEVLRNFKKSGAKYLLTTTFSERLENKDLTTHFGWRPLNIQKAPFNFSQPLEIINEQCTEVHGTYNDKSLGLWLLEDIHIEPLLNANNGSGLVMQEQKEFSASLRRDRGQLTLQKRRARD